MSRWEPDATGRLQAAALELYAEQGFDQTTVAQIAARAGLTERTFFRHFVDKREVLFRGAEQLQGTLVDAIDDAPASTPPLQVLGHALEAISPIFDERRPFSARRHAVIAASPELLERELIKRASLAAACTAALQRRGVPDHSAGLIAETGITVFFIAFERWLQDPAERSYATHVRVTLAELREVTAAPGEGGGGQRSPVTAPLGEGGGGQRSPVTAGRAGSEDHSLHEPG